MTNISRTRGDDYANEFIIKSKKTRQPINIAGYSFTLTVDPSPNPANSDGNLFQLVGQIVDAATGRVAFAPTAVQADRVGTFYYDIQMVDSSGKKRTIVKGEYQFTQDITK